MKKYLMKGEIFALSLFIVDGNLRGVSIINPQETNYLNSPTDILEANKQDLPRSKLFTECLHWLEQRISSKPKCFNAPQVSLSQLDLTDFQRDVLAAVSSIAVGEPISYREVAQLIGKPQAVRAVGSALRKNPLQLLIPCHRVVKANGQVGGFSGGFGEQTKRKLLLQEATTGFRRGIL